jgi:hypothetical protein
MNEMGCLVKQSGRRELRVGALRLSTLAVAGALVAGCSSGIDGVPDCAKDKLVVTGSSAERKVDINATFSSGQLEQPGDTGGTMTLALANDSVFTLRWDTTLENDTATVVTGSVNGVPGGPLCFGADSEIEIGSDATTFHLMALHACDASSIVPGELFGCAGLAASSK